MIESLGILILLAAAGCSNVVAESMVKIQNNRYSGIVIAINPNITEDPKLVDAIKDVWTEASANLFTATRSRAYFGDITILIPKSWENVAYDEIATRESYDAADVLIAYPNPSYGDAPYTVQYGGCGSTGSYIHLTPDYLTEEWLSSNFGPRGKVVVHEWAHYRWGVFDETDSSEPFYDDRTGNTLTSPYGEPSLSRTQCTKDIPLCCLDTTDPNARCIPGEAFCKINPNSGLYSETCTCYLPQVPSNSEASIMAYQYVDQIQTFCDDSPDSKRRHNKNAPNDQNRLCNMRSTWSVISESPDFLGVNPSNPSISNLVPRFTVKKAEQNRRFVLVLDVSGSMSTVESTGETRIEIANKAAVHFINTVIDGSLVGIVQFQSYATTISNLHALNDETDREDLRKLVPTYANGGTCIGCGIDEAIDVLERYGPAAGGYIIVMTDGLGKLDQTVASEAMAKGVIVETLIIYTSTNDELVDLSLATGGSWFFARSDDLLALIDAYSDFADPHDGDVSTKKYEVFSETMKLDSSSPSHFSTIVVDATIGQGTTFTYTWSFGTSHLDVTLTSPSGPGGSCGTIHAAPGSSSCADVSIDTTNKMMTITIKGTAELGDWRSYVQIPTHDTQTISIIVTSKASGEGGEPIMAQSSLDMRDGIPIVYAKVTQGLNPVLGADVIATVSVQGGSDTTVILYDAGADPDIRRNDGIYSRYVTGLGPGRYSVKVSVESRYGGFNATVVKGTNAISRATYNPGFYLPNGTVMANPNGATFLPPGTPFGISAQDLGNFSRQASAGAFDYNATSTSDVLPPSRVLDLIVRQNDFNNVSKGIVLSFTAPGDDYDSGTASRYEIRYTLGSPQDLINNFTATTLVTPNVVMEGDISNPQTAGLTENFIVATPSTSPGATSISIGFALKSYDEVSNEAQISNVANIRYYIQPPSFALPVATTVPLESTAASTDVVDTTYFSTLDQHTSTATTSLPTITPTSANSPTTTQSTVTTTTSQPSTASSTTTQSATTQQPTTTTTNAPTTSRRTTTASTQPPTTSPTTTQSTTTKQPTTTTTNAPTTAQRTTTASTQTPTTSPTTTQSTTTKQPTTTTNNAPTTAQRTTTASTQTPTTSPTTTQSTTTKQPTTTAINAPTSTKPTTTTFVSIRPTATKTNPPTSTKPIITTTSSKTTVQSTSTTSSCKGFNKHGLLWLWITLPVVIMGGAAVVDSF